MMSRPTIPRRLSACRIAGLFAALLLTAFTPRLLAQGAARFDLLGPKIDIRVTRDTRTLPIAMVPNLQPGDKIFIHPDLPSSQSAKLIMVIAFLRGTTNPPPEKWFTYVETWNKKVQAEGISVIVPEEAQQALIFVAPETGGDLSTLRSAVRGRPGIFVRASQDLNESSYEQSRIEHYIEEIKQVPPNDAKALAEHSKKLSATLNLKPNDDCFKRPPDQQASCLSQTGGQLLLDDGHGQTVASTIANGPSSDLIGAAAATPMFGAGVYSAYVGAVVDLVRIMSGLHTAKFQYIPAISFPKDETLNLRLNVPPSFHDPKSVIVIGLPAIQQAHLPPLRPQDPKHISCLLQPNLVLPLEGAPLVFSTSYAHDLVLKIPTSGGPDREIPLKPDAFEGGLVATAEPSRKMLPEPDTAVAQSDPSKAAIAPVGGGNTTRPEGTPESKPAARLDPTRISGTIHGFWGFDAFEGPVVDLQSVPGKDWRVAAKPELIAGKENHLLLQATGTACVQDITATASGLPSIPVDWKSAEAPKNADTAKSGPLPTIDLRLPLERSTPGDLAVSIRQYGAPPEKVSLTTYSESVHLTALHMHAGDHFAMLSGSSLKDVRSISLRGAALAPAGAPAGDPETLRLDFPDGKDTPALQAGEHDAAQATLKDGRTISVPFDVDSARPTIQLLSKDASIKGGNGLHLNLPDRNALPLTAKLTFVIHSESPSRFARTERIEISTLDESLKAKLTLADGSLVLQDAQTVVGFFKPLDAFGQSAFGPLQMRPVMQDGTVGDWVPLGTLVRVPVIQQISCPRTVVSRRPREPRADQNAANPQIPDTTAATDGNQAGAPAAAQTPAPPADGAAPANPAPAPQVTTTVVRSKTCTLTGSNLFLIDSFSPDGAFNSPISVPVGFAGDSIEVPHPVDGNQVFFKLRDNPSSIASVKVSASPMTAAPAP